MTRSFARFLAALLGLACCACAFGQSDLPDRYLGRKYWYEPEHEKYVQTEFYRLPNFDKGSFTISKKTQFAVAEYARGWFRLRFESGAAKGSFGYIPSRMLRTRLYEPKLTESVQETFRKASIFEEDPEVIRKRLERAAAVAPKGPVTPPPWVIKRRPIPPLEQPPPQPPSE